MTALIVVLLLVSNIYLATKVFKSAPAPPASVPTTKEEPPAKIEDEHEKPTKTSEPDIVGKSALDIDEFRKMFREEIKEAIPLIVKEMGTPADAGWQDEDENDMYVPHAKEDKPDKVIPNDKLGEAFTNVTVSELTGETPEAAEPMAEGIDFKQMDTAIKVLKGKSDRPEDVETARRVLSEQGDTEIIEVIKLDPVIQKRILMIECRLPEPEQDDEVPSVNDGQQRPKPKKIVYHADINTEGIDAIDFNIYH